MKKKLSIEFNILEDSMENIVHLATELTTKFSTNIEKLELIPHTTSTCKVSLGGFLVLSAQESKEIHIDVLGRLIEKEFKSNGIDCFGWDCSDVLRKTERD